MMLVRGTRTKAEAPSPWFVSGINETPLCVSLHNETTILLPIGQLPIA